jgi:hypothetical protein
MTKANVVRTKANELIPSQERITYNRACGERLAMHNRHLGTFSPLKRDFTGRTPSAEKHIFLLQRHLTRFGDIHTPSKLGDNQTQTLDFESVYTEREPRCRVQALASHTSFSQECHWLLLFNLCLAIYRAIIVLDDARGLKPIFGVRKTDRGHPGAG